MADKGDKGLTRRGFIKCSAVLGSGLFASQLEWAQDLLRRAEAGTLTPEEEYELIKAENTLYTVCLQCLCCRPELSLQDLTFRDKQS